MVEGTREGSEDVRVKLSLVVPIFDEDETIDPLRVWGHVGATISIFAFAYALFLVILTLVSGADVPGYASLMVVVLLLGGINLLSLGIIGEYLGRTYMEVKNRPLYIVRERHGFDGPGPRDG